ncbi:hypothetical protein FKG94_28130 [Exilibacterium tricleocarpae]|uniref:Integrin n=2 Tax=Exilibacterium tricleocarpae TaxID=2591008 RepID=A0A545SL99_9GAMM|nr:hypothetical protein FKG94_28130 [Exilibacterium tricleocarpae]
MDYFGSAVSLSGDGNTLAVGASGEDSEVTSIGGYQGDNSANEAGAVYLGYQSPNDYEAVVLPKVA